MIEFNRREQQVLKQLFKAMKLENNRTVAEEILDLDNASYIFVSGPGQIRLKSAEWRGFCAKLQAVCQDEEIEVAETYYDIGGEG